MKAVTGRSVWMGQCLGLAVALYAAVACGNSSQADVEPLPDGGDGGTQSQGQGGTVPNGGGGNGPDATTGTVPNGQGGSVGGHGGTEPTPQGGSAGDAGGPGTAGADPGPGLAGAAGNGGAGGDNFDCDGFCQPCREGYAHVDCESACICESVAHPRPEHQALLACDFDEPCPDSVLLGNPGSVSWQDGECLLTALRDRTPGRYRFSSILSDLGSVATDMTLLVSGDEVLVLPVSTSSSGEGALERTYLPVQSCTLRSPETLEDCVAAGTDPGVTTGGGGEAVCDEITDWVRDCVEVENPECPSE